MKRTTSSPARIAEACLVAAILALALTINSYAQTGIWTTRAPIPIPVVSAAAGIVNGKLYIAGGWDCSNPDYRSAFDYEPTLDAWRPLAPMPAMRLDAAGAVVDGILYVIGGEHEGLPLSTVHSYDPVTDTWSTKAPMPTPRSHLVAGVMGGVVYVTGGSGGGADLSQLEAYDPKTDTWTEKAPMPTARSDAAAGVIDGVLYVVGGTFSGPGSGPLRVVEAYDPKTNSWSSKAPIPGYADSVGAAVLAGKLYVTNGGGVPGTAVPPVMVYDPTADSWGTEPSMPTGRNLPAAGVVDDTLYVVGGQGYNNANPPQRTCFAVNEALTPFLMVSIDIKPGDATNTINLRSNGVVPVAILGSATFDPMTVDPTTVTLAAAHVTIRGRGLPAAAGVPMTGVSDVNGDGYPDLLLYFRTQDLTALEPAHAVEATLRRQRGGINPPLQEAVLYGTTYSGQRIRGSDTVRIVPAVQFSPRSSPRGRTAVAGPRT
jgi:N-acetylneuraminic acid mutarotase